DTVRNLQFQRGLFEAPSWLATAYLTGQHYRIVPDPPGSPVQRPTQVAIAVQPDAQVEYPACRTAPCRYWHQDSAWSAVSLRRTENSHRRRSTWPASAHSWSRALQTGARRTSAS